MAWRLELNLESFFLLSGQYRTHMTCSSKQTFLRVSELRMTNAQHSNLVRVEAAWMWSLRSLFSHPPTSMCMVKVHAPCCAVSVGGCCFLHALGLGLSYGICSQTSVL